MSVYKIVIDCEKIMEAINILRGGKEGISRGAEYFMILALIDYLAESAVENRKDSPLCDDLNKTFDALHQLSNDGVAHYMSHIVGADKVDHIEKLNMVKSVTLEEEKE